MTVVPLPSSNSQTDLDQLLNTNSCQDCDLSGANLITGANFTNANFTDGNLSGANFTDSDITGGMFKNVNLFGATISSEQLSSLSSFSGTLPDGTAVSVPEPNSIAGAKTPLIHTNAVLCGAPDLVGWVAISITHLYVNAIY